VGMATIGEQLLDFKRRTAFSLDKIAARAGYKGRTSVQKMFNAAYDADALSSTVAVKLEAALVGEGKPPISRDEIWALVSGEPHLAKAAPAINEPTLMAILTALGPFGISVPQTEAGREALSGTLRGILRLLERNPSIADDPVRLAGAVEGIAVERFDPIRPQP